MFIFYMLIIYLGKFLNYVLHIIFVRKYYFECIIKLTAYSNSIFITYLIEDKKIDREV